MEEYNIAKSLGFAEEGNQWFVYRLPYLRVEYADVFHENGMQVYLPVTETKTKDRKGQEKIVKQPKVLNYLFVLATRAQVDKLSVEKSVSPVYSHRNKDEIRKSSDKWLTVPNSQMHMLMTVIQNNDSVVNFSALDEQLLKKGDRVEVIDGPFKGIEGVLLTSQGAKGGKVYVSLSNTEGLLSALVPEDYLRVVEFSRSNDHFYRKIEAFEKILNEAVETYRMQQYLDTDQRANLQMFLTRYDRLRNLTHVNNARLTACRYAALVLLGRDNEAEACLTNFDEETQKSASSKRSARRSPSAQKYIDLWRTRVRNCQIS